MSVKNFRRRSTPPVQAVHVYANGPERFFDLLNWLGLHESLSPKILMGDNGQLDPDYEQWIEEVMICPGVVAKPGDWVVLEGGVFSVYPPETFRNIFEEAS